MVATTVALLGGTDIAIATTLVATVALTIAVVFMVFLAVAPMVSSSWRENLGAVPSGEDYGLESQRAD